MSSFWQLYLQSIPLMQSMQRIVIPLDVPLFLSYNSTETNIYGDSLFCLTTGNGKHPHIEMSGRVNMTSSLNYPICTGTNMVSVHREVAKKFHQTRKGTQLPKDSSNEFICKTLWVTPPPLLLRDPHLRKVLNH